MDLKPGSNEKHWFASSGIEPHEPASSRGTRTRFQIARDWESNSTDGSMFVTNRGVHGIFMISEMTRQAAQTEFETRENW